MSRRIVGRQCGSSLLITVLALSLLVAAHGPAVAAAGAVPAAGTVNQVDGDPHVVVSNVTVAPEQPAPGERTVIRATIQVAESSPSSVDIGEVNLRGAETLIKYAGSNSFGTVTPGGSLTVPLSTSFDNPGVKKLQIYVNGDDVNLRYPLIIAVNEGAPRINVGVSDPTVESEAPLTVNVSNGDQTELRDLELTVAGSTVEFDNSRRLDATLAAGSDRQFDFDATFTEAGRHPIEATLRYTTVSAERRTLRDRSVVDVVRSVERPQIEVAVADAVPGATRPMNVTIANGLDSEIRQVRVVADSPTADFEVTERVRSTLAAGGNATFQYPASVTEAEPHTVNVTLHYTNDGARQHATRRIETSFGAPANPGEITLTDVDAMTRGSNLEISATASNVGSSDVEAVVVSADGERVAAADYFVGGVDASDFASFTLSTTVEGNVSTVPVQVTYVVDGVERSFTRDVPVSQAVPAGPDRDGGGGLPVLPVLALVVVVGAAAVGYRRLRG